MWGKDRTLDEILQSVSDVLFPAELGEARVSINSVGTEGDTPLHVLIWRNDTLGALALIDNGADINAEGDMRETPLHVAARMKNQALVAALLEKGAATNRVSEFGQTAQEVAAEVGLDLGSIT